MIYLRASLKSDRQLQATLAQKASITNRTLKDATRDFMRGMVRVGFTITPPGSGGGARDAVAAGRGAIARDLHRMGIVGVEIKGFRTITQAFGRPIEPVTVKTKIPSDQPATQADVDLLHYSRLTAKHGGRVTRGRQKLWFVRKSQLTSLKNRLFREIGTLASWLIPAATQLSVSIPAFIARQAGRGRGAALQVFETATKISMRVVGHFPPSALEEANDTQRRLDAMKRIQFNKLRRELPVLLRKKLQGKL